MSKDLDKSFDHFAGDQKNSVNTDYSESNHLKKSA